MAGAIGIGEAPGDVRTQEGAAAGGPSRLPSAKTAIQAGNGRIKATGIVKSFVILELSAGGMGSDQDWQNCKEGGD